MKQINKKNFSSQNTHIGKFYVAKHAITTLPETCGPDYAHWIVDSLLKYEGIRLLLSSTSTSWKT